VGELAQNSLKVRPIKLGGNDRHHSAAIRKAAIPLSWMGVIGWQIFDD
jgi:hypothetical protein